MVKKVEEGVEQLKTLEECVELIFTEKTAKLYDKWFEKVVYLFSNKSIREMRRSRTKSFFSGN